MSPQTIWCHQDSEIQMKWDVVKSYLCLDSRCIDWVLLYLAYSMTILPWSLLSSNWPAGSNTGPLLDMPSWWATGPTWKPTMQPLCQLLVMLSNCIYESSYVSGDLHLMFWFTVWCSSIYLITLSLPSWCHHISPLVSILNMLTPYTHWSTCELHYI